MRYALSCSCAPYWKCSGSGRPADLIVEPDGGSARLEVGRRSLESLLNVVLAAGREGSVGLGVSIWRWHQALPGRKTLAAIRAQRLANPRCDWLLEAYGGFA